MGRRLHLIPLLALGAALNGCRDAVPPLAPTISRPRFSQVSGPLEGKITFNSNRNGNVDVFVMNPDGSGVTQVTTNPLDELLPLFSPDGTQIVFGRCSVSSATSSSSMPTAAASGRSLTMGFRGHGHLTATGSCSAGTTACM